MKRNQPQPQRRTTRTNRAPAVESPERRAQPQTRQPKESGYQEDPGWGSLFRRDAQGNQPNYTGTVNDPDGDELQIAIWIRTPKGGGAKYLRVHLEPPYTPDDDDPIQGGDDPDDVACDEEDIPFCRRGPQPPG